MDPCWLRWAGVETSRQDRSLHHDPRVPSMPTHAKGRLRLVWPGTTATDAMGGSRRGTSIHCAFCGSKRKAKGMPCLVTMQCDNSIDTYLVFLAESPPPPSPCRTMQLVAVIMANNAHQPGVRCGRSKDKVVTR